MTTIREVAEQFNCTYEIDRALTFYPAKAQAIWNVPVAWDWRLGTTAGRAHSKRGITLHPGLPHQSEGPQPTFLHEVAHMLQFILYGEINHGRTWWECMYRLGRIPKRTHSMPLSKAKIDLEGIEL